MEEEIIVDILRQLPVKSLLRFKCVSIAWNTFITQPHFKKQHLNHSKNHKKMLIQLTFKEDIGICSFYSFTLSSRRIVKDLELSPLCKTGSYCIHCCYDGLVLVGTQVNPEMYSLFLWNPSTRESVLLPQINYYNYYSMYGLGYDLASDDYKVFKVADEQEDVPYEILALKGGPWRTIDYDGHGCYSSDGVDCLAFVNGAIHWFGLSGISAGVCSIISSFDISSEVFGEVQLPEGIVSSIGMSDQGVTELGGMLSFHCVYKTINNKSRCFHLWVMKDYGVNESWTKLFTIGDTTIPSIMPIIPKYIFEDGELLFSGKRRMVFRTSKGPYEISNLIWPVVGHDIDKYNVLWGGYVFTESLISPLEVNH